MISLVMTGEDVEKDEGIRDTKGRTDVHEGTSG